MNKAANLDRLSHTRILVVGDIMLDRYEYGNVERISPEAPVPVFRPSRQKTMLGGVGNVAANLAALGCSVDILSPYTTKWHGKYGQSDPDNFCRTEVCPSRGRMSVFRHRDSVNPAAI